MRIVVLDGYALNPGDLSWEALEKMGDLTVYDRTPGGLVLERARGAEILLTNKTAIDGSSLARLPGLTYVGVLATGYNIVDVEAARRQGIIVTNIPSYGTMSVAQMTFALLLELCHHAQDHSSAVHAGAWTNSADFCFWNHPQIELAGKTFGIIGLGRIGRQVAGIAASFGMHIIACDSSMGGDPPCAGFQWVQLADLFARSDVVSLHCPLAPDTRGIICRGNLALMKRTAFLINTSRGPLVVEEDLAQALNAGLIAGAGVDVLSEEPPPPTNPLLAAKNCIVTPHIAWASRESRVRLMTIAAENLRAFLEGTPRNVVGLQT